jgi:hypothetical protein
MDMDEIEKMKEWQDHQYDPGYYTGGRMPHFMFTKKYKRFALATIIVFIIIFVIAYL